MLYDSNRKIQKLYRSPLILQVEEICIIGVKHTIKKRSNFFTCSYAAIAILQCFYPYISNIIVLILHIGKLRHREEPNYPRLQSKSEMGENTILLTESSVH